MKSLLSTILLFPIVGICTTYAPQSVKTYFDNAEIVARIVVTGSVYFSGVFEGEEILFDPFFVASVQHTSFFEHPFGFTADKIETQEPALIGSKSESQYSVPFETAGHLPADHPVPYPYGDG